MATEPSQTSRITSSPEASRRLTGAEERALRERLGSDLVIQSLDRRGLPITRQNWIDTAWDHAADGEWTQEHEDTLPRELKL